MNYRLPRAVTVGGREWPVRTDYRAALDILAALDDPELDRGERLYAALVIFYPDYGDMPVELQDEALSRCFWFLNGGKDEESSREGPRLVSWEQDFTMICAPVNRVLGREIRAEDETHWWTFLSAYMEIGGDCLFSQVVSLRDKLARHSRLDRSEREWLRRNRDLVEIRTRYTQEENDLVDMWIR